MTRGEFMVDIDDRANASAPILSIVIPAYNAQEFLRRCLDSIVDQVEFSSGDVEIVCIDDGSTDGTARIISGYEKVHKNVRFVHQPNEGKGSARNHGIREARGEYLTFIDADDKMTPNALGVLLPYLKTGLYDEILFMWRSEFHGKTRHLARVVDAPKEVTGEEVALELLRPNGGFQGSMCGKAVKRCMLDEPLPLRIDNDLGMGEDHWFWFQVTSRINSGLLVPEELYVYIKREGSESCVHAARWFADSMEVRRRMAEFAQENFPEVLPYVLGRWRMLVAVRAVRCYGAGDAEGLSEVYEAWDKVKSFPRIKPPFCSFGAMAVQAIVEVALRLRIPARALSCFRPIVKRRFRG